MRNKLLRYITCIMTVVVMLFFAAHVARASSVANISARVGFNHRAKAGGVNPVLVSIKANVPINGTLKLCIADKIYTSPIKLGYDAIKEYHFSVPIFSGREKIMVQIEVDGDILTTEEITPEIMPSDSIFIGVLSDTPEKLYPIARTGLNFLDKRDIHIFPLEISDNTNLFELDNMNLILIDDFNTDGLDMHTQTLLKRWILTGNTLIVGKGPFAHKTITGFLKDTNCTEAWGKGVVVPVDRALGAIAPEELIGLIQEYTTSQGLAKIVEGQDIEVKIHESRKLYSAADSMIVPADSTRFMLILLTLAYVVTMGISIFMGQNRSGHFPLVIILFCGIFHIVALSGGLNSSLVAGAAVDVIGNEIRSHGLLTYYPHKETVGKVKSPHESMLCPLDDFQWEINPIENSISFLTDQKVNIHNSTIRNGLIQTPVIQLHEEGLLTGRLKNPRASKMNNCFLVVGDTFIDIGEMDGKEELEFNYKLDHNLHGLSDYNYLTRICQEAKLKGANRQLFEYYHYCLEEQWAVKLMGFSTETEELQINGKVRKVRVLTLNVVPLQLSFVGDRVFIPAECITPIVEKPHKDDSPDRREMMFCEGEEAKIYFAIPKYIIPEEIRIFHEASLQDLKVYNRCKAEWESILSETLDGEKLREVLHNGPLAISLSGSARSGIPQIEVRGTKTKDYNGGE